MFRKRFTDRTPTPAQPALPRAPPSYGACGGARTGTHTRPQRRYAPGRPQRASRPRPPRAISSRQPYRARHRPMARVVARAPALTPARNAVTRQSRRIAQEALRDAEAINPQGRQNAYASAKPNSLKITALSNGMNCITQR